MDLGALKGWLVLYRLFVFLLYQREINQVYQSDHQHHRLLRAPEKPAARQTGDFADAVQRQRLPYQDRIGTQASLRDHHAHRTEQIHHKSCLEAKRLGIGKSAEDNPSAGNIEEIDQDAVQEEKHRAARAEVENAFDTVDATFQQLDNLLKIKSQIIEESMDLDNRDQYCRDKYGLSFKDIHLLRTV